MAASRIAWGAIGAVAALVSLPAQDSRPAPPPELRAAVEAYLGEREEAAAAKLLDALVKRPDATPDAVQAAIVASDVPIEPEMHLLVPHQDQLLKTTIRVPPGHARTGTRLPVMLDIAHGDFTGGVNYDAAIVAFFVSDYKPNKFEDEGRDAFVNILRRVAHLAHGDPERLWFSGFSWGAHASWDTAIHRPGVVRGIATGGGGPRLNWFRLLSQLAPVRVRAFCGQKDDARLIVSLRDVERLAPKLKLDYVFVLDPALGHEMPLKGTEEIPRIVQETPAHPVNPMLAPSGVLLADAAHVESPLLRMDAVDDAKVSAKPIPVSGGSEDEVRRATLAAWAPKVAKITWKVEEKKDEIGLTLFGDGVVAATVFLREPMFHAGSKATVRVGAKAPVFSEVLAADPKTMLSEARRTGDRLHPPLRAVEVRFGK